MAEVKKPQPAAAAAARANTTANNPAVNTSTNAAAWTPQVRLSLYHNFTYFFSYVCD